MRSVAFVLVVLLVPVAVSSSVYERDGSFPPSAGGVNQATDAYVFSANEGDLVQVTVTFDDARGRLGLMLWSKGSLDDGACDVDVPGACVMVGEASPVDPCDKAASGGDATDASPLGVTLVAPTTGEYRAVTYSEATPLGLDYHIQIAVAGEAPAVAVKEERTAVAGWGLSGYPTLCKVI